MQEERIKNLISRSETILIIPANPNEPESFNAALALAHILNNMGKNANIVKENILPPLESSECKAHLTINTSGRDISQIYYEKDRDKLNIFIDYKNGSISPEDISLANEIQPPEFDLLITIGVDNLATLEDFAEDNFKLFYEKPIININNNLEAETFGQVNILKDNPLAQIIIASFLDKTLLDEKAINLLKESAVSFAQKGGSQEKLLEILEFLAGKKNSPSPEEEPALKPAFANLAQVEGHGQRARFVARAMQSMEIDLKSNIPLFYISAEDFLATGSSAKNVAEVAALIKQNPRFNFPGFAIMWQKPNNKDSFDILLYFQNPEKIRNAWQILGGETKGNVLLCSVSGKDENQAKTIITNIL